MPEDASIYDGGWDGPPPPISAADELADLQRKACNAVLEDWIIENGLDRRRDVRREEDRRATADLIAACRRKGLLQ